METKKVLAGRVTKAQKQSLLQCMQANRALGCGQFSGPDSARKQKEDWMAIAQELNSKGGASKNGDQWKRCWIDWKASVKRYYGALKRFQVKTGNLPSTSGPKEMDELDEQMVQFFAKDVFEGDSSTKELGLMAPPTQAKAVEDEEILFEEYLEDEFNISFHEAIETPVKMAKTANRPTNIMSTFERALDISSAQNAKQIAMLKDILAEQKKTNMIFVG